MSGLAERVNGLSEEAARKAFGRCCASTAWVSKMSDARPFRDDDDVARVATAIWQSLERDDWLQAFAAHPRIGDTSPGEPWSSREQAGMTSADEAVRTEIAELNREYERRFGHVFLICATGLGAEEMLAALRARLANDEETELLLAAREQDKITRLRLRKLVNE